MTRDQYIHSRLHVHLGLIFDAALARRSGAELGLFYEQVRRRLVEELGRTWDEARPKPPPVAATNGPMKQAAETQGAKR